MKTQETLEKFAEKLVLEYQLGNTGKIDIEDAKEMLIEFAKWQQERSYSEEDMKKAIDFMPYHLEYGNIVARKSDKDIENFIEQFKKK